MRIELELVSKRGRERQIETATLRRGSANPAGYRRIEQHDLRHPPNGSTRTAPPSNILIIDDLWRYIRRHQTPSPIEIRTAARVSHRLVRVLAGHLARELARAVGGG
jgi:hypothetical protein